MKWKDESLIRFFHPLPKSKIPKSKIPHLDLNINGHTACQVSVYEFFFLWLHLPVFFLVQLLVLWLTCCLCLQTHLRIFWLSPHFYSLHRLREDCMFCKCYWLLYDRQSLLFQCRDRFTQLLPLNISFAVVLGLKHLFVFNPWLRKVESSLP